MSGQTVGADKVLLVGIDEAGYGPTLGPYCLGSCALKVPADYLGQDLWHLLASAVTKNAKAHEQRLMIADSKQVHAGRNRGRLMMSALALARSFGYEGGLENLPQYLGAPSPLMADHPWYSTLLEAILPGPDALPSCDWQSFSIDPVQIKVEATPEGAFNRGLEDHGNKARFALSRVLSMMAPWIESESEGPGQPTHIVVDRQGGRCYYADALAAAFPFREVKILEESAQISRYQVGASRISFLVKADQGHMPVAMASIMAKAVRELYMEAYNHWWQQRVPGLKATAGYPVDARRFLQEIDQSFQQTGLNEHFLIRQR